MVTTIIIDDEQHCINRLSGLLEANHKKNIRLEGCFQSLEAGIKAIYDLQPGLVFLDVQLRDKTGFDLLKQLDEINFEIIFTTAYEKYAVQAFKFSAMDYLLKPVDAEDLQQALHKLENKLSKNDLPKKFETLLYNLQNVQGVSKRISVPTVNGLIFLQVNDIMRCESAGNYTTLFLKDKQKITVAKTLKEFEELLTEYNFYRVHNSHLINIACIKSYHKGKGGYVSMTDNSHIEISTRRKDDFLKKLAQM